MDFLRRLGAACDQDWIPWKTLILTFSIAEFGFETYLQLRQRRVLQQKTIPLQLKNEIDQKTFDKSQEYGKAKADFSIVQGVWEQLKNLAMIQYDFYPFAWRISGIVASRFLPIGFQGEITRSLIVGLGLSWIGTITSLPFSYYYHFVLEEKYGFNKQTMKLWITDMLKGQALGIAFGIPLGSAFLKIIQVTGDNFFFYIWLFMLSVQLLAVVIYPTFIVPLFNKLMPLEEGELKTRTESLAARLKFPLKELQVIDGSKRSAHSNAYFTGLPFMPKKIVLYDTLIEKSEIKEIEAVLAHELGHWKMGHTVKLLGIASGHLFYVFALFSVFIKNKSLYRAFGFYDDMPILMGFNLFNAVLTPTDSFVKLGMNSLTRKFEFEADRFSYNLGYASELASALIKLQIQNLSSMDADWMYSAYHYSHPILTERLKPLGWTSEKKVSSDKPKVAEDAAPTPADAAAANANGKVEERKEL